jgi:hypothetical protein
MHREKSDLLSLLVFFFQNKENRPTTTSFYTSLSDFIRIAVYKSDYNATKLVVL